MTEAAKITIDIKNNAISDNRGNGTKGDTIVCDGSPMQVNEARAQALLPQVQEQLSKELGKVFPLGAASSPEADYDWKGAIEQGNAVAKQVEAIGKQITSKIDNITVTLNPGVESPLTTLCNAGKASGVLER